jgi:MDMPI C-terminal domain
VDRLAALAAWTGRPRPGLQVRVETTGAERVFLLAESGERAELTAADPTATGADLATLRLPAEAFVRLVYGRLDADHTPEGVQADGLDLDDLRKVFPGP